MTPPITPHTTQTQMQRPWSFLHPSHFSLLRRFSMSRNQGPLIKSNLFLHGIIVVKEIDIPRPFPITSHKLRVALWSFVFAVACQHALQGHAYALDVLHRTPARISEEVEADYAVGIDMWVNGDGAVGPFDKGHFWRFNWVLLAEFEFQSIGLIQVQGVFV